MYHYQLLLETIFKVIFFVLFLPYKIVATIVSYYIGLKLTLKHKNQIIQNKAILVDSEYKSRIARDLFYLCYDEPINVGWRKFKRNKINKWAISLIVWSTLIYRYTMF